MAPPPSPPPKGRGVITEIPLLGGCTLRVAPCSASTIAETLCELCMPEAFCGIETLVERFCYICVLCERKNSPASHMRFILYRGCVLFLTE